jgi:hypothetical protein
VGITVGVNETVGIAVVGEIVGVSDIVGYDVEERPLVPQVTP